jgi:hypothetical protein
LQAAILLDPRGDPRANWITGQLIAVDGGMSLMDPGLPMAIQQPELATA